MKPGDLVQLKNTGDFNFVYDVVLFRGWGKVPGGMETVGKFTSDEIGTLIESNLSRGGNGCKVITSSGIVGWMHHDDLEALQ